MTEASPWWTPDGNRSCLRVSADGTPCTAARQYILTDIASCRSHLSPSEVESHKRGMRMADAIFGPVDVITEPACWSWDMSIPDGISATDSPEWALSVAQGGRCAACAYQDPDGLYLDHCHKTGLMRGYLCRSCNTMEGVTSRPAPDFIVKYRERNPASMLGIEATYVSPVTGGSVTLPPRPRTESVWDGHPMKGLGL